VCPPLRKSSFLGAPFHPPLLEDGLAVRTSFFSLLRVREAFPPPSVEEMLSPPFHFRVRLSWPSFSSHNAIFPCQRVPNLITLPREMNSLFPHLRTLVTDDLRLLSDPPPFFFPLSCTGLSRRTGRLWLLSRVLPVPPPVRPNLFFPSDIVASLSFGLQLDLPSPLF